jgi:DNA-binding Lrp family transcriptional regulator
MSEWKWTGMDFAVADPDSVLDSLDQRVICALQVDGLAPAGRIAEVLGVSERTVARRLARMSEAGVLRVVAWPDQVPPPGTTALLLRVRVLRGRVEAIARSLARRADVPFVDVLLGGEEISAVALVDAVGRDRLLFEELPGSGAVTASSAQAVLHLFADAASWRAGLLSTDELRSLEPPAPPAALVAGPRRADALEAALLAELGRDARQPAAELALRVGAPASTVRRRVAALRSSGRLRTHATVDPRLLGMAVDATVWMTVPPRELRTVGEALARQDCVHGVAATTGATNLMATVFCADLEALYAFTSGPLAALPITTAETTLVGRAVKRAGLEHLDLRLRQPPPLPSRLPSRR